MRRFIACASALVALAATPTAFAHVTVQPNEAVLGSFSRFVVRVPNERPDASTTKVKVIFPGLAFVSFEPKDGWTRSVEEGKFAEPIEAFGEEQTEGVLSVTWSGGSIEPGEFDEFGFSAKMPDAEDRLEFKAIQTYSSGETVRWTGPEDGESPAARVAVYDIGAEEGQGTIAVLAETARTAEEALASAEAAPVTSDVDGEAAPVVADDDDDEDDDSPIALVLGAVGTGLGLIALILALRKTSS